MPQNRLRHQTREWAWAITPWLVLCLLGFLFAQPPSLWAYYRREWYLYIRTFVGTLIAICLKILAFCAYPLYGFASCVWKMLKQWQKAHQDQFQSWILHQCKSMRNGLVYWIPRLWESVRNQWLPWSLRQFRSLSSLLYTGCSVVKAIPTDTVRDFIVSTAMLTLGAMVVWELYKRKSRLAWTSLAQNILTKTRGISQSRFRMIILGMMVVCISLFWGRVREQHHLKHWWRQLFEFSKSTWIRVDTSFWNWLNGKGLLQ